jgi:hypothetical protein
MCGRHKESHNLRSGNQENNMASFWLALVEGQLGRSIYHLRSLEKKRGIDETQQSTRLVLKKCLLFKSKCNVQQAQNSKSG